MTVRECTKMENVYYRYENQDGRWSEYGKVETITSASGERCGYDPRCRSRSDETHDS